MLLFYKKLLSEMLLTSTAEYSATNKAQLSRLLVCCQLVDMPKFTLNLKKPRWLSVSIFGF